MRFVAFALLVFASSSALAGSTFVMTNADAPGEGFNDPTPATPVGGNPGTTLGEQRLQALQHAANLWGAVLDSVVPISIVANFDPLTCTVSNATFGAAGTVSVFHDFANAPQTGTWYPSALANRLAREDLDPSTEDISLRFNSNLNGSPSCMGGAAWYYGFDGAGGANQIDLVALLTHELAHGLGFQTFVNRTTGALFLGMADQFLFRLFDTLTGKYLRNMSDSERLGASRNGRGVVWTGPNALMTARATLSPGTPILLGVSPPSIAAPYSVGESAFGSSLSTTPVSGNVAYADDTAASKLGCAAYAPGTFTGQLALIDRGTCSAATKTKHAQDAGATGVIIVDNSVASPPGPLTGVDPTITIPSVLVTQATGVAIKAALPATMSLVRDQTVLQGADASDRVLVLSANPSTSSNLVHFDSSVSPDTLMKTGFASTGPFLTASTDLRLALAVLRDVGWQKDTDNDGVADDLDLCIHVADPGQTDLDGDHVGDACDDDDDGDGSADVSDNCPTLTNVLQADLDQDGLGDACDADDDQDAAPDASDNCPRVANVDQADRNSNGAGDACDDADGDAVSDSLDNCPDQNNADQANADGDAQGDVCDDDDDDDTVLDAQDNCALVANVDQQNDDGDLYGNACDDDLDGDGVLDAADNCPVVANGDQLDSDGDKLGDLCDSDQDGDGVANGADNCAFLANGGQTDTDGDDLGDACDDDDDSDGVADAADDCPLVSDVGQQNSDGDMAGGDACDPNDDADFVPDGVDNCQFVTNPPQSDTDADGLGDACDADDDGDGVPDASDDCAFVLNPDQIDRDADGMGSACDADDDGDSVIDTADNCPTVSNRDQKDGDGDLLGDACDAAPVLDPSTADAGTDEPIAPPVAGAPKRGCSSTDSSLLGAAICLVLMSRRRLGNRRRNHRDSRSGGHSFRTNFRKATPIAILTPLCRPWAHFMLCSAARVDCLPHLGGRCQTIGLAAVQPGPRESARREGAVW